jgi:hypothetical protein
MGVSSTEFLVLRDYCHSLAGLFARKSRTSIVGRGSALQTYEYGSFKKSKGEDGYMAPGLLKKGGGVFS